MFKKNEKKKTELKVNKGSKGRILNKRGTQSERLIWQKHGEQIKIGKYILDSCLGTVQEMPTIKEHVHIYVCAKFFSDKLILHSDTCHF